MRVNLISDFVDFYDEKLKQQELDKEVEFRRMNCEREQRAVDLKNLRDKGIETIKIIPVTKLDDSDEKVVVYINNKKHHGEGKVVTTSREARKQYNNYSASIIIENEQSVKVVSVGRIKIKIFTSKSDSDGIFNRKKVLINRNTVNIFDKEHFISSIDYVITKDGRWIATDFNSVENLGELELADEISVEEIISEFKEWIKEK